MRKWQRRCDRQSVDLDAAKALAVIDRGAASHLSFFSVNEFGELKPSGSPIDLGAADANGVADPAFEHRRRQLTRAVQLSRNICSRRGHCVL
jgi:hypothetical protein